MATKRARQIAKELRAVTREKMADGIDAALTPLIEALEFYEKEWTREERYDKGRNEVLKWADPTERLIDDEGRHARETLKEWRDAD